MASSKSLIRFDKIFIGTLGILFGIVALALTYKAVTESTESRSKAAEAQTIYKQWEFNGKDSEGWSTRPPHSAAVRNGSYVLTVAKGNQLPIVRNTKVGVGLPQGIKTVQFSMAVGNVPTITKYPTPSACPVPVCDGQLVTGGTNQTGGCPIYKCIPIAYGTNVQEGSTVTDEAAFSESVTAGIACPMDAKLCPDGSSVGRIGPKCVFAPCPSVGGPNPTTSTKPIVRKFTALLYYQLANKKHFEKPLEVSGVNDSTYHQYSVTLPNIKAVDIAKLRIVFTSGVKIGESVSVDWVRLQGPLLKATPTPTPPVGCRYEQVTCVKAPCDPILVCSSPTPTCIPLSECVYNPPIVNGKPVYCSPPIRSGASYCPRPTIFSTPTSSCKPVPCAAPPSGCYYQGSTSCSCGTLVCQSTPTPTSSTTTACLSEDINNDGVVNETDVLIVKQDMGNPTPTNVKSDVDKNGKVDIFDYNIVYSRLNQSTGPCSP